MPDAVDPSVSEVSTFAGVVGADWQYSRLPEVDSETRLEDATFALGRFWLLMMSDSPVIFSSTSDPEEWEVTTLESLGVSPESARSAHFAPAEDSLTLVLTGQWDSTQGASQTPPTPILLTTSGDGWSTHPQSSSLVSWQPSEVVNDKYLSYRGLTQAAYHEGALTLVSSVGWFRPFETSDVSLVTMTLGAGGDLHRNVVDRPPFGSDAQVRSQGLFSLNGTITLITTTSLSAENRTTLVAHRSDDGVNWQSDAITASSVLGHVDENSVWSWTTGDTVYIQGLTTPLWDSPVEEESRFLIRSTDGVTWEPVDVPSSTERYRGASDGERDYVFAPTSFTSGDIWVENEEGTWERVAEGLSPRALFVGYPGGITTIDRNFLDYSGPWPD